MKKNNVRKKTNIISVSFFVLCFVAIFFVVKQYNNSNVGLNKIDSFTSPLAKLTLPTLAPTTAPTSAPTPKQCNIDHCSVYSCKNSTCCKCSTCNNGYESLTGGYTCTKKATPVPTTAPTPEEPVANLTCSGNMKMQSTCINEARNKCSSGYKGCDYTNARGCYSYTCNQATSDQSEFTGCVNYCIHLGGTRDQCNENCDTTASECTVTVSMSAKTISVGDSVSATIHAKGCKEDVKISCSNLSGCPTSIGRSGGSVSGTVVTACQSATVTATADNGVSASATVGGGTNTKNPWVNGANGVYDKKLDSNYLNANDNNANLYGTCTSRTDGKWDCTNVHTRSVTCGGVVITPDPTPSITYPPSTNPPSTHPPSITSNPGRPDPTPKEEEKYNYCCVDMTTDVKRGYYRNQSSISCPSGSYPDTNIKEGDCNNYGCYADSPTLATAHYARMQDGIDGVYQWLIKGITNSNDCHAPDPEPTVCDPDPYYPTTQNGVADKCEGVIKLDHSDGSKCKGVSNPKPFYTISCKTSAIISYDHGDDNYSSATEKIGSINVLYPGRGFKFGITVQTLRRCDASFDANTWLAAYKITEDNIRDANSKLRNSGLDDDNKRAYNSLINKMLNLQDRLKKVVNAYNNYDFANDPKESGTLSLAYKVDDKDETLNKTLTAVLISSGSGDYVSKSNSHILNVSGLTNPFDYTWSNESHPRTVKLMPPKTYLDRSSGKETTDTTALDGGNKIYIDTKATPTGKDSYYQMTINLSGIVNDSTAENTFCYMAIPGTSILYRPIDVANPFINASWKPGENWINKKYDFRKVIHATTWSEGSLYTIGLSKDDITSLQNSNKNHSGSSPYLGLCERYDEGVLDDVTKQICNINK